MSEFSFKQLFPFFLDNQCEIEYEIVKKSIVIIFRKVFFFVFPASPLNFLLLFFFPAGGYLWRKVVIKIFRIIERRYGCSVLLPLVVDHLYLACVACICLGIISFLLGMGKSFLNFYHRFCSFSLQIVAEHKQMYLRFVKLSKNIFVVPNLWGGKE